MNRYAVEIELITVETLTVVIEDSESKGTHLIRAIERDTENLDDFISNLDRTYKVEGKHYDTRKLNYSVDSVATVTKNDNRYTSKSDDDVMGCLTVVLLASITIVWIISVVQMVIEGGV